MAQTFDFNTFVVSEPSTTKNYSLNLKGLMMHLVDVMFTEDAPKIETYTTDLSEHIQRDIGIR